jgi:hypothetical protein
MIFSRKVAECSVLEEVRNDYERMAYGRHEMKHIMALWEWAWSIAADLVQVSRQASRSIEQTSSLHYTSGIDSAMRLVTGHFKSKRRASKNLRSD